MPIPCQRILTRLPLITAAIASFSAPAAAQFEQTVAPGDQGYIWIGPKSGLWTGFLETPGGDIRFQFEVDHTGNNGFDAAIVNGRERIPVSLEADPDQESFIMDFPHYDSSIRGDVSVQGNNMNGQFFITKGPDLQRVVNFNARLNAAPWLDAEGNQIVPEGPTEAEMLTSALTNPLPTTWAIDFADQDTPSVGRFYTLPDGVNVEGTILNVTGDYRYLNGTWDGTNLTLSTFDGAHAFLFKATRQDDGSLAGDFWSGNHFHTTWTAVEDQNASLPDNLETTSFQVSPDWDAIRFPDLEANQVALSSYIGQPLVIELMGTWCPNCHDAARLLGELETEFAEDGLRVLAIAFEYTGDFERDVAQVRRYKERYGLDTEILIGGLKDKDLATESLGFLDEVRAYPTTIFVDPNGRISAVYTGFNGPATGDDHQDTINTFRREAQRIINTP